jgi:hypothetical protein
MEIRDIPTALQNITACALNPHMNIITMDVTEASPQMIAAIRERMMQFPDFRETTSPYTPGHLRFERII